MDLLLGIKGVFVIPEDIRRDAAVYAIVGLLILKLTSVNILHTDVLAILGGTVPDTAALS